MNKLMNIKEMGEPSYQKCIQCTHCTCWKEDRRLLNVRGLSPVSCEVHPRCLPQINIGWSWQEHMDSLREVFHRLRNASLLLIKTKSIINLGHGDRRLRSRSYSHQRLLWSCEDVKASLSGIGGVYQAMLNLLIKGRKCMWSADQQPMFDALKTSLTQAPVLSCEDFGEQFTLQADASLN